MSTVEVVAPPTRDGVLVAAVLAGDRDAQARLFTQFHPRITAYVRARWTRDVEDSADLVQQVWERVMAALPRFDLSRPLWPWLKVIVDNTARNERRATLTHAGTPRTVAVEDQVFDVLGHVPSDVGMVELECAVTPVVATLPERQRLAFIGIELEGLSHAEVGERLGLKTNAVRQLLHRARLNIREALGGLWGLGPTVVLQRATGRLREAVTMLGPGPASGMAGVISAVTALLIIGGGIPNVDGGPFERGGPAAPFPAAAGVPGELSRLTQPGGTDQIDDHGETTSPPPATPAPSGTAGAAAPPVRDGHPEVEVVAPVAGVGAGTRAQEAPEYDYGVEIEEVGSPPVGSTSSDPALRPVDAAACDAASTVPGGYCNTP